MSRLQDEVDKIERLLDDLDCTMTEGAYMVGLARLVKANSKMLILIAKTLGRHEIHADES